MICASVGPAVGAHLVDERLQRLDAARETEMMRRAERAARICEQRAVVGDQRRVGLRVAPVDGEDHASTSAARRSSSCSATAYCAISGCASNAFFTSAAACERAAVTASRS